MDLENNVGTGQGQQIVVSLDLMGKVLEPVTWVSHKEVRELIGAEGRAEGRVDLEEKSF